MFDRLRVLVVKELLTVWRDKKTRITLIVPPLLQMCVFTFAATQEGTNVSVAVLNQDAGVLGRDLIARIEGSPNFARVVRLRADAEVAPALDSQAALVFVRVGPDFSRKVSDGEPAAIQLLLDGRRATAA